MRAHLAGQTVPDGRLHVIHNWSIEALPHLPRDRQPGEPFTICYSGNLGRVHNVEAIIDLIARTADIPGMAYKFVGGGVAQARLQAAIAAHGWSNVTVAPYAPRAQLGRSLAACDAHLVSLDPACEGLIQPSKIYGILAVGRPTLFLGDPKGGIARLLDRHDCGLTLDAARPDTWRAAIEALIPHPDNPGAAARQAEMARNARAAHDERYAREHALAAWAEVLAPVAEPVRAGEPERAASAKAKAAA
jgi:glycosyltransferase involved in cell wall biosynthesis